MLNVGFRDGSRGPSPTLSGRKLVVRQAELPNNVRMADLSTLSGAEHEVLLLLANGHTAKSAAARLDVSVNVINERLRSARSKTGVGSSRELARLVQACAQPQEVCPKKIGLASGAQQTTWRRQPVLTLRIAFTRGALIMAAFTVTAGFVAYALSIALASAEGPPPAPHVISTYPALDEKVAPGNLALRVTFDRPMRADSYSFVMLSPDTFPSCAEKPAQSADRRTFTLHCTVERHHAYKIGLNSARFQNFAAAAGDVPAVPATLRFSTR